MEIEDALTIMFLFEMFILALFTYIVTATRESKNPPEDCQPKVGFVPI